MHTSTSIAEKRTKIRQEVRTRQIQMHKDKKRKELRVWQYLNHKENQLLQLDLPDVWKNNQIQSQHVLVFLERTLERLRRQKLNLAEVSDLVEWMIFMIISKDQFPADAFPLFEETFASLHGLAAQDNPEHFFEIQFHYFYLLELLTVGNDPPRPYIPNTHHIEFLLHIIVDFLFETVDREQLVWTQVTQYNLRNLLMVLVSDQQIKLPDALFIRVIEIIGKYQQEGMHELETYQADGPSFLNNLTPQLLIPDYIAMMLENQNLNENQFEILLKVMKMTLRRIQEAFSKGNQMHEQNRKNALICSIAMTDIITNITTEQQRHRQTLGSLVVDLLGAFLAFLVGDTDGMLVFYLSTNPILSTFFLTCSMRFDGKVMDKVRELVTEVEGKYGHKIETVEDFELGTWEL